MLQIARQRQVLCITHLPQVAAAATAHYVVNKQVKGGERYPTSHCWIARKVTEWLGCSADRPRHRGSTQKLY